MKFKLFSIVIFTLSLSIVSLMGQGYSKPTRMTGGTGEAKASLTQDVALLKEQLGEMRFEVERLLRENESLEVRLRKMEAQNATHVSELVFRQELSSLRAEFIRLNKAQREELATQLTKQIRALARELEKAAPSGGGSTSSRSSQIITSFDPTSYPQTGIYYVVKSGDTLSKIASSAGSKVAYITHANKIPNPDRLQVGKELFIPIDNP